MHTSVIRTTTTCRCAQALTLVAMIALSIGCNPQGDDDVAARDTTVALSPDAPRAADSDSTATSPSDAPAAGGTATVGPTGFGPLRIGMTADELRQIAPGAVVVNAIGPDGTPLNDSCFYLALPPNGRQQATMVMIIGKRVARVEIGDSTITTNEGAGIGDTEERIREIYGSAVAVEKHKYTDGNYLIVSHPDGIHKIVFETDGTTVVKYRAGRDPEVGWVEGCS